MNISKFIKAASLAVCFVPVIGNAQSSNAGAEANADAASVAISDNTNVAVAEGGVGLGGNGYGFGEARIDFEVTETTINDTTIPVSPSGQVSAGLDIPQHYAGTGGDGKIFAIPYVAKALMESGGDGGMNFSGESMRYTGIGNSRENVYTGLFNPTAFGEIQYQLSADAEWCNPENFKKNSDHMDCLEENGLDPVKAKNISFWFMDKAKSDLENVVLLGTLSVHSIPDKGMDDMESIFDDAQVAAARTFFGFKELKLVSMWSRWGCRTGTVGEGHTLSLGSTLTSLVSSRLRDLFAATGAFAKGGGMSFHKYICSTTVLVVGVPEDDNPLAIDFGLYSSLGVKEEKEEEGTPKVKPAVAEERKS